MARAGQPVVRGRLAGKRCPQRGWGHGCALWMNPRALPIYELESAVVASLRTQGRLIVQAPTGSGKSTQIPQMLLRHGVLDALGGRAVTGEVVV